MAAGFILAPAALILFKVFFLEYRLKDLMPDKAYRLTLSVFTTNDNPGSIRVRTFAPLNDIKQTVIEDQGISDSFSYEIHNEGENRVITWQSNKISGENKMEYSALIQSNQVRFLLDEETVFDKRIPAHIEKYLGDSGEIQTSSELIAKKTDELTRGKSTLLEKLEAIHRYIVDEIRYKNFSGGLDAQTALLLQEASCNGKSRLYVAMVRRLGIPARVVGGIILNRSPKKTIHQWVEVYINGQWVTFCPTNDHFAELPKNYITLYRDDEVLFKRSTGIKFDYAYSYETESIPKENLAGTFHNLEINIFGLIEYFEKFNLSLGIFVYLLMLPLAAFVSVIMKNVIGLETFGTFLPILLASVMDSTGLLTGLGVFFCVIFFVYLLNRLIAPLELLYHPRMAILLSFVILALLVTFNLGLWIKNYNLLYVVFFPVAILAITINRVVNLVDEASFKRLMLVSINTVFVTAISFYFIHSTILQLIMLSFPETVLLIIGLNILVGRWAGFRMTEYFRFEGFFR